MGLFCTERFRAEFERLKKKKPYSNLEDEIFTYFKDKGKEELLNGTRLNGSSPNPYIKKRLDGRGGYRIYYLLITEAGDVYLVFLHPKTGPDGSENILDTSKKTFYSEVVDAIESRDLYEIKLNSINACLDFKHCKDNT